MPMKRVRWATRRLLLALEMVAAVLVGLAVIVILFMSHVNSGDYRREVAAAVHAATGFTVTILGPLQFGLTPEPTLMARDVRVENPTWPERPEMMRIDRVEVAFSPLALLKQRPRFLHVTLTGADIHLETSRDGRVNWWVAAPAPPLPPTAAPGDTPVIPAVVPPDILRLDLIRSRLDYRDRIWGRSVDLMLEEAQLALPHQEPMGWTVKGRYFGTPFEAEGQGGTLADLVNDAAVYPLRTRLRGAGTVLDLDGQLARPLSTQVADLAVAVAGERMDRLESVLGLWLPEVGPFQARWQMHGSQGAWQLDTFSARVGASDAAGRLELDTTGPRWRLAGRLRSTLLRQEDLVGGGPALPEIDDGRLFSARLLPFATLGAMDARIHLEAGRYVTWPLDFLALDTQIDLSGGRLVMEPFRAGFAGGRLELRVEADSARTPARSRINGRADGLVMETLFPALGMTVPPTGPLDLVLDLGGSGDSLRTLLARSQGGVRFLMGRGSLPIHHFDLIASDLLRAAMPWARSTNQTETNCTSGRLGIGNGLAVLDALLIDTGRITVTGGGVINLSTEALDILLRPRPKDPSLLSLATPMRVTGTLAAPSAAPDALGLAQGAATGLILGSINPLAALLPFFSLGTGNATPCVGAALPDMSSPGIVTPLERLRSLFR